MSDVKIFTLMRLVIFQLRRIKFHSEMHFFAKNVTPECNMYLKSSSVFVAVKMKRYLLSLELSNKNGTKCLPEMKLQICVQFQNCCVTHCSTAQNIWQQ